MRPLLAFLLALAACASPAVAPGPPEAPPPAVEGEGDFWSEDQVEFFGGAIVALWEGATPAFPARIELSHDLPDSLAGDAQFAGGLFVLRISASLPFQSAAETLVHEWAHALAWFEPGTWDEPHGPQWGLAYSRSFLAYEAYVIEWNEGR